MKQQRWMAQNFFIFYMCWGIFLPYWTGFLVESKGLTVSEASIIMSCSLVIRGLSTLFLFPFIAGKWSSKHVLDLFTIFSVITLLLYIPAHSFPSLLVVTLAFSFFFPALMPALDSVAGVLVQHHGIHYGISRSFGSLGFIVMVLLVSMFTWQYGDGAVLWLLLFVLVFFVVYNRRTAPHILLERPVAIGAVHKSIKALFKVPHFLLIIMIAILLQGAHASYYNYGYLYLQELGVAKYYIGMIINVGVLFEILFFAKADLFFRGWRPVNLLLMAAIGSTIRWLMVSFAPNVLFFSLSQSLHALSFALAHYAVILFFTQNLQKEQIPNAQGMYNAFAMGWSTAVFTVFGGFLYEIEPRFAFLGMTACTIPALLLILYLKKKIQHVAVNA